MHAVASTQLFALDLCVSVNIIRKRISLVSNVCCVIVGNYKQDLINPGCHLNSCRRPVEKILSSAVTPWYCSSCEVQLRGFYSVLRPNKVEAVSDPILGLFPSGRNTAVWLRWLRSTFLLAHVLSTQMFTLTVPSTFHTGRTRCPG